MSETSDSFEKIEQSALSGSSASGHESGDLTVNHQQSISESSATAMACSTVKTVQLKDLEFEIPWKSRDEIIAVLNQHTELLSGLIIQADAREKMQKANIDLVAALLNLSLKAGGRRESSADKGPNEVVLDLSAELKSRIMDTLITNHHYTLLEATPDSVSSECKTKLVDGNNELICELIKLRSRTVSKGDHLANQATKASELQKTSKAADEGVKLGELGNVDATLQVQKSAGQPVSGQMASGPVVDELATLKEELEKLKSQVASEFGKQISDQTEEISSLKENVRGLKRKIDESGGDDFCRKEATFTWELKGVDALLAGATNIERRSEFFYCRGMPWYLVASLYIENKVKYLCVFLYIHRQIAADSLRVVTDFEIRLLSSNPGPVGDLVQTGKDLAFANSDRGHGWGWIKFITVEKLRAGSFIENDTIKLRVHLTTKSFERIGYLPKV